MRKDSKTHLSIYYKANYLRLRGETNEKENYIHFKLDIVVMFSV